MNKHIIIGMDKIDGERTTAGIRYYAHEISAYVTVREADVARAKLNLDYATIRAPIDGTIGAAVISEGALVVQNATHFVTRTSFLAVERLASAPASAPLVVRTNMARPLASSPAGVTLTELGDGGLVLVGLGAGEGQEEQAHQRAWISASNFSRPLP
jgi:multidrug efflux pump subunit AcrA (membrane-fusion protein)